ncbi:complex I assembly factor ACAD9, mitochondrial isoform X1 [Parasteatoda tepidariorum]|uniref:complex I assembly factor ACAD9, mitochondrial isoform X1 n=1 Tax=Parasteatoda tepidariorum TaxID=114398 RepID=UPI001C726ACE|nr:complex I assembly factor ACAD9, mitochondrial [Parasteatoda tepidariorum]XP_042911752.1 complex I assembly factor ACAD9, mitochondrial [Parasteatoda tepidariorum]
MEPSMKYLWPVLKQTKSAFKGCKKFNFAPAISSLKYSTASAHAEELVTQEKIHVSKPSITKWKRPPFLKNFFLGKFDTELLAFPEILDKEQVTELEKSVQNLSDIMKSKVNSVEIDESCSLSESLLQELKDLGLFGRMIPSKYGGLDLSYTACTRLNEALGLDWSLFSTIAAHEFLATEAILKFGSEAQKSRYFPKLASGELIAAFCCSESNSGCDLSSISTTVEKVSEDSYLINGTKTWVTNAGRAGVFIVFAKSENPVDPDLNTISAFIVDGNSDGIKVSRQHKTCLKGLDTGIVQFQGVVVPASNLIGSDGDGFSVYLKSLESFRIAQNTFTFGTLKALLDAITERVIHTERLGESMADKQLIRRRLSKISSILYAMESVSYFTAALLDSTENPDVELESAALKLFNSKGTLYCVREMMELIGTSCLTGDMQLERFFRDALGLAHFDMPNDITKLFLSMNGFKVAGATLGQEVMESRNTFFFPKRAVSGFIRRWKVSKGLYKYSQDIAGHIHPSLVTCGNRFEEKLQEFQLCVESILIHHGQKVILTQLDPWRLADAAADLYAFAAVLSRCSRSYCLGMKNSHQELLLAGAFCHDIIDKLTENMGAIVLGVNENNEANHLNIGSEIVDCKGYFAEHPLKHNF